MKEGFIANCKTHDGTDTTMLIATKLVPPAIFLFHVETCDGIWG